MNGNSGNLIRAIRGPIMLITVGSLFAIDRLGSLSIGRTWPAFLIVLGLLLLLERIVPGSRGGQGGAQ